MGKHEARIVHLLAGFLFLVISTSASALSIRGDASDVRDRLYRSIPIKTPLQQTREKLQSLLPGASLDPSVLLDKKLTLSDVKGSPELRGTRYSQYFNAFLGKYRSASSLFMEVSVNASFLFNESGRLVGIIVRSEMDAL